MKKPLGFRSSISEAATPNKDRAFFSATALGSRAEHCENTISVLTEKNGMLGVNETASRSGGAPEALLLAGLR